MHMRSLTAALAAAVLIHAAGLAQQSGYQYVSPKPGASLVSRHSTIIVRYGPGLDAARLPASGALVVTGEKSGVHEGTLSLAGDGRTLLFAPALPFAPGERVRVSLQGSIRTQDQEPLPALSFGFTVTPLAAPIPVSAAIREDGVSAPPAALLPAPAPQPPAVRLTAQAARSSATGLADSLPADFPVLRVDTVNAPAPGRLFMTTSENVPGIGYYLMMLENDGSPFWYRKLDHHYAYDFKVQPNGLLSFADIKESHWFAGGGDAVHTLMDSTFTVVDSFKCGNGYWADSHDFVLLPNGHALMFAYDLQPVDMSLLVSGGNPAAMVAGSIVQEVDAEKRVVFEWRSWDHSPVTDSYMNLKGSVFDYCHINSIDLAPDGNILISSRNLCEVAKISRTTGEVLWRLGGKKNQFTFIGENPSAAPTYFTHQHCARVLPNGNLLLLDNGNGHTPTYSRAVEYRLDEQARTATLAWEYRHVPEIFAPSRGSVQRLPNGNTLVGWGTAGLYNYASTPVQQPSVTEVRPDKSVAYELHMPPAMSSFRAWRFPWPNAAPVSVRLYELQPGVAYAFAQGGDSTGVSIQFQQATFGYNSVTVSRSFLAPRSPEFAAPRAPRVASRSYVIRQQGITSFTADVTFDVRAIDLPGPGTGLVVYQREFPDRGVFLPLAASYDAAAQTLTARTTAFGEFIIAAAEQQAPPPVPVLVTPAAGQRVNQLKPVLLRWSVAGFVQGFRVQAGTDSLFRTTLVDDSALVSSRLVLATVLPETTYYWRVQAGNELGKVWSAVRKFRTAAPFLSVSVPNGGESWARGSSQVIRWQSNAEGKVRIMLVRTGAPALLIMDSVDNLGGYLWKVPAGDSTLGAQYRIRIATLDGALLDSSDAPFSLKGVTGVVAEAPGVPSETLLMPNYPNPFNPSTTIHAQWQAASRVKLAVYDLLGREVAVLVDGVRQPERVAIAFDGSRLVSGVYLCRLEVSPLERGPRSVQVRKMALVK